MTAPTWSVNRLAARAVALNATDPEEAHTLLDMLGLVDTHGRLAPDDVRNYDIDESGPEKGNTINLARRPRQARRRRPAQGAA